MLDIGGDTAFGYEVRVAVTLTLQEQPAITRSTSGTLEERVSSYKSDITNGKAYPLECASGSLVGILQDEWSRSKRSQPRGAL